MEVLRVGPDALLVEVEDVGSALDLAQWARGRIDVIDLVPAARTVLFDGVGDVEEVRAVLAAWQPGTASVEARLVEVPVTWDGPDLDVVAELWQVTTSEVIQRVSDVEHVVAFCGFAPGFPYLTNPLGLPEVPRRSSPRVRVEPGSVGLAGPFAGIYPTASPGGWQLIGRTEVALWQADREQPALLPPGTRVRFSQK